MSVDPQHWADLNRLLDTALDLPPADRERWLETLDPSFDKLKPELRDLLSRASRVETHDFLNTLPKFGGSAEAQREPDDAQQRQDGLIGPYRLIREIGAGGMGTVWLAERTDGAPRRPVALKLPHVASSRIGLAERMARERDILATLEHPGIARLYDAGVSPEGRPYLALEYIEGVPIDRFCRERNLDVPARLRLFLKVAAAAAYAHAKLVIHRDLKPANILVTGDGEVRLLDFGVAKLLGEGRAESTRLTELSGRALTPDYASPEQILGQPLTIATDVYSLGVVLYELLAQTRPYRLARESRGALEDAILQSEPSRPSDVAPAPERKALRGDLDTLVLTALRKKPEERYPTVNAFADDVVRHLERRPVLARPPSAWYHTARFISRNRVSVSVAGVAAVAVLVGAGIAAWQARVAVAEGRRAEEVREFIASILRDANLDRDQSRPASVLELLKQAADRVQTLEAEPAVRVELLNLIGSGLLSLGDTDALENVAQRAVDEGTRALGPEHPLTISARTLTVRVHMYRGRTQQMGEEIDALMKIMERDEKAFADKLVELWRVRADHALDTNQAGVAEAAAREAVARAEALYGARHAETLRALGILSVAYRRQDKHTDALNTADRARNLALELYAGNPLHPMVIYTRAEYARVLADAGRLKPAVEQLTVAARDAEKVYGPDARTVGFHLQNLTGYQIQLGSIRAAIDSGTRAVSILKQHAQPGSFSHAAALNALGQALLAARRGEQALPIVLQTQDAATRIFGPSHPNTMNVRADHAFAVGLSGKLAEARTHINAVVEEARLAKAPPTRPFHIASELERLSGRHRQALERAQESLSLIEANQGRPIDRARALTQIGLARLELGAPDAMTPLEQAIVVFREVEAEITPFHADALIGLARLYLEAGRPADALPLLQQADHTWRELDAASRWAGEASLWLGQGLTALGRAREGAEATARGRQILARSPFSKDAELAKRAAPART